MQNPPHKWRLNIYPAAQSRFDRLKHSEKHGIFRRLQDLLEADDPYSLTFVEMLKAEKFDRSRKFRVGNYRVFFVINPTEIAYLGHTYKGTLILLDIRDRKEAY